MFQEAPMKEYELWLWRAGKWAFKDAYLTVQDAKDAGFQYDSAFQIRMFSGRIISQVGNTNN